MKKAYNLTTFELCFSPSTISRGLFRTINILTLSGKLQDPDITAENLALDQRFTISL